MDAAPPDASLQEVEAMLATSPAVSRFATTEPGQAVAHMVGIYGPHALELQGREAVALRVRGFELAGLHLAEIRYGSPAVASMSEAHRHWVFSYLRQGSVQRDRRGETYGPGAAGVKSPDAVMDLVMSADMELVNLRVPEQPLLAACRALLGTDPAHALRFDEQARPGSAHVRALLRVMGQLAATPRYGHPAAQRFELSVRDAALYELLLAWPHNAHAALDQRPALPISTRRARDYIHAHAAELPTVAEIAAAAGVGVRALARGFDKHLGTSPLRYLQDYRLDRVREALLASGPDTTVTRIALDWGFLHLGAFAIRYRERFGETPSQTLRRQRVF